MTQETTSTVKRTPSVTPDLDAKGGVRPNRIATKPIDWRLVNGHLTPECSFKLNGSPACPVCLLATIEG